MRAIVVTYITENHPTIRRVKKNGLSFTASKVVDSKNSHIMACETITPVTRHITLTRVTLRPLITPKSLQ